MSPRRPNPPPWGSETPTVRLFEPEDHDSTERLWSEVFHRTRSEALSRWLYDEHHAGPALRAVAVANGQIVAHAALLLRRFVFAGTPLQGGMSVDAMTAAPWQRRGLNRRLWALLEGEFVRRDLAWIYGFSNENSTFGAQTYQNRIPIRPFPLLVRPIVNPRSVLARLKPHIWEELAHPAHLPLDWSQVGSDWRGEDRLRPVLDPAYGVWRYGRPGGRYRWASVGQRDRPTACGAVAFRHQLGVRAAFLMDTVAETADAYLTLIVELIRVSADAGAWVMTALAIAGTPEYAMLKKLGFVAVPDRLKPERISLSVRWLDSALPQRLREDPRMWQIGWSEHDLL